jgi:protein-S-isoprenylcysteine O-methyltransferase Ste14
MALVRHLAAILILPGTVLVLVPVLLLGANPPVGLGWELPAPWGWLISALGGACVGGGLWLLGQTIALFARRGRGTLAPWDPPRHLVVRGVYCYVRNPMISGVLSVLLGEALLLGSGAILTWFLVVAALNGIYIPLLEETQLAERFGAEYELYRRHVPRWVPRLRPWVVPWAEDNAPTPP